MSMEPNLVGWFKDRPAWLQQAAKLLIDKGTPDQKEIENLVELCVKDAIGKPVQTTPSICSTVFAEPAGKKLRLSSIGDIKGINALSPKKHLTFGSGNLSVIFGQNGSGKSGYVRILKHLCGARAPGKLYHNVYEAPPGKQSCSVVYDHDGASVTQMWENESGTVGNLRTVDIFDTHCGQSYVDGENEVTYEPEILLFFSELIAICEKVSSGIDNRMAKLVSKKPALPAEYSLTPSGKWYVQVSGATSAEKITANCDWTLTKEKELEVICGRLAEQAPAEKARLIRKQNEYLESTIQKLQTLITQLSEEGCQTVLGLRQEAKQKENTARIAAEQLFQKTPLQGIGSDVWVQLWALARKYSEDIAYAEQSFPFVGEDALCVLCQQPLSDVAKKRVQSFEDYIKGEIQKEAELAQKAFDDALAGIEEIPTPKEAKIAVDAAGLSEEAFTALQVLYEAFKSRKDGLRDGMLSPLPNITNWVANAKALVDRNLKTAKDFDDDAQKDNRVELNSRRLELEASKWVSQQKTAIEEEIKRLNVLKVLQAATKLANTKSLSLKKGELAETLITDAFVQRFNGELAKMGAAHINVELIKTKVSKGRVLHSLRLKGAKGGSLSEVLSEGEYRIISLASFLADVTGKAHAAPFVFDDPISSLDQIFEEAVVRRLVALSKDRQVIVFTHRLSLLGLIQDYSKAAGFEPDVICIRREHWGAGEPGGTPLIAKKPASALNALLGERLPQARKLFEEHGQEVYFPLAKSLCSDFRILLERMVEFELLADVVQRYRRDIMTKGKIRKLAHITEADCNYFDEMMTKYSRYEHSQPLEAPVQLPSPDDLKADLEGLKKWREDFADRAA